MSIEENVAAGRGARDVFNFALSESRGLTKEGVNRFWTVLGQKVNEQLKGATKRQHRTRLAMKNHVE